MTPKWSSFGERFTRRTGSLELMEDLGGALGADSNELFLGGGNPGKIPEMQRRFQACLTEIAASGERTDRLLGNYAHPKGELKFRQALARLLAREYGWPISADNVALTGGSQAGFFLLFNLLAGRSNGGADKKILLPLIPEYIGYADLGVKEGLFIAQQPVIEELPDGFFKYHVDFAALEIAPDVGAVCISRPTNPTGNVVTDRELAVLDELTRNAGVPLIVDNAYGLPFPGIVFVEAQPIWNDNVILCMSLSKLGLPGVRTGIVVANEAVVDALMRMTAVMSLAVGSVGPVLLENLLDSGEIIDWSRRFITPYYRDKADFACTALKRELDGVPFRIHVPEGAFFLWLWLPGLPITSAELYKRLKRKGVLVISGHHFFPGLMRTWTHQHECLRISFAQGHEVVEPGMRAIAAEIKRAFAGD